MVAGLGHNRAGKPLDVEVRLFNTLTQFAGKHGPRFSQSLSVGSDVGDLVRLLQIPLHEIHLVLVNGKDVTPTLGQGVCTRRVLEDGDTVALSGPVPYSWGYGAPVV